MTRILFQISVVDPWGGLLILLQNHVHLLYFRHVVFFFFSYGKIMIKNNIDTSEKTHVNFYFAIERIWMMKYLSALLVKRLFIEKN